MGTFSLSSVYRKCITTATNARILFSRVLHHTYIIPYCACIHKTQLLTKFHQSLVQICANDCTLFRRKTTTLLYEAKYEFRKMTIWGGWRYKCSRAIFARIWFALYKGIGSLLLANYHFHHGLAEMWACTSNHMECFMWDTITHPWHNFNAA